MNDAGLTRRQREERRRANQRLATELDASSKRPGSNQPPVPLAEQLADVNALRDRITVVLDRTALSEDEKRAAREIVASRHVHQAGSNTLEAFLWALEAMLGYFERPDSPLHGTDALLHVHIGRTALRNALDGKREPWLALLAEQQAPPKAGAPALETAADLRAFAAAAMEGLVRGYAARGGTTQTRAAELVEAAFGAANIPIAAATAVKHYTLLNGKRGRHRPEYPLFQSLIATLPPVTISVPLSEREAWLARLADAAGRRFMLQ